MPKRKEKTRKKRGGVGDNIRKRRAKTPKRLTFADQYGKTLEEVSYHPNLHYSYEEEREENDDDGDDAAQKKELDDYYKLYITGAANEAEYEEGIPTKFVPLPEAVKITLLNYIVDLDKSPDEEEMLIKDYIREYHNQRVAKGGSLGYVTDNIHKPCCNKCEQTCIGKICRGNFWCKPCKLDPLNRWNMFRDDHKARDTKCQPSQLGGKRKKRRGGTRKRRRRFKKGTKSKTHRGKDFETRKTSKYYNSKRWKRMTGRRTRRAPLFPWA